MRITGAEGYRKTAGELTGTPRPGKEEKSIIMDKDMEQVLKKAEVLIEALPYIQKFNRKIIVVKYGGSAMIDGELKKQVIQDVTLLNPTSFKRVTS